MDNDDVTNTIMGQVKIYCPSKGWKIFFSILTFPLIIIMVAFIFMPFIQNRASNFGYVLFCSFLGVGGTLLFSYCFFAIWKSRIEIYSDRIRYIGTYKSTEILIKDIDGFKIVPTQYVSTLSIIPKDPKAKKIEMALLMENQKDFLEWINQNVTNLDAIKAREEINLILQDNRFGATETERNSKLQEARNWVKIFNGLGIAVSLWVMFWPYLYQYAIGSAILMPLISLSLVYRFKGIIKLDGQRNSVYPDVSVLFILPSLALALRAANDWHILTWNNFWVPFVEVFIFLILLVFTFAKDVLQKKATVLSISLFCCVYAYGDVITLNGILDKSIPTVYRTQIASKRISTGKYTSYYFVLLPWGPVNNAEDFRVGRMFYNKYEVGNTVKVYLKKGRVGINWFYIRGVNNRPGNLSQDIVYCTKIIEKNPNDADAYNRRGIDYRNQGNWSQAIIDYTKSIEINPNNAAVYWNRALAYDAQGNLLQAISDYTKDIKLNPKDALAFNNRGIAYENQGNLPQAISDYNKCIEIDPKHAHAYNNRGTVYTKLSKFIQAMSDFNKAIELDPNYTDAYNSRGIALGYQGQFPQAIADFTKAIKINPNNSTSYLNRGNTESKVGNFSQAISDYSKVIEINPNIADAYDGRGGAYYTQGNMTQAISDLSKAIEINANFAGAYYNRGNVYAKQNNLVHAIFDYTRAVKINPNLAEAYIGRGAAYDIQGIYDHAMSDYSKGIEIHPNYQVFYDRGRLYDMENTNAQAIVDYSKCIELNPIFAGCYYKRGLVYYKAKDFKKTLVDILKAEELGYAVDPALIVSLKGFTEHGYPTTVTTANTFKIDPNGSVAHYNSGISYNVQGNITQAIFEFTKTIKIDPNFAGAYYNRGVAYTQQNQYKLAIADFSKFIETNPTYAEVYYKRGCAYFNEKDYDKAWIDVHKAESLGFVIDPDFINMLKKALGKDK